MVSFLGVLCFRWRASFRSPSSQVVADVVVDVVVVDGVVVAAVLVVVVFVIACALVAPSPATVAVD